MRVVLDTNVLASGFVVAGGIPDRLLRSWQAGRFELVVSAPILDELARAFAKPSFARRLPPALVARVVRLLRRQGRLTPLTVPVTGIAAHPEDDLILATARSGRADVLVTGDGKLHALNRYETVRILTPRAFLDELMAEDEEGA